MKVKKLLILGLLLISTTACSSGNDEKEQSTTTDKNEVVNEVNEKEEKEQPYLIEKYFEIKKGASFEEVSAVINDANIIVEDPGEYDAQAGYKKREVSFIDGDNKLDLVFRDNKLGSKTFTYNQNDSKSTWFYSNFYDILDAKDEVEESFGIWVESINGTEFNNETEMYEYLKNNEVK